MGAPEKHILFEFSIIYLICTGRFFFTGYFNAPTCTAGLSSIVKENNGEYNFWNPGYYFVAVVAVQVLNGSFVFKPKVVNCKRNLSTCYLGYFRSSNVTWKVYIGSCHNYMLGMKDQQCPQIRWHYRLLFISGYLAKQ